ncbi:hypothetical protein RYO59_002098 [Thermosynechococcaceae cyanobacterium Okahandja]
MVLNPLEPLEAYSHCHPQEVLLVEATVGEELEVVLIFKGVSSSLVRPTVVEADVPVLPPEAVIIGVDRLASPYNPNAPVYLERGIPWPDFQERLLGRKLIED